MLMSRRGTGIRFFFDKPKGPICYTPREVLVTAGDQVAFAPCLLHCDGTSAGALDFRLTTGLKEEAGAWTIVHEHHSVPTIEERFIGPGSTLTRCRGGLRWCRAYGC
jgi:ketosteroid isomerase-like protein